MNLDTGDGLVSGGFLNAAAEAGFLTGLDRADRPSRRTRDRKQSVAEVSAERKRNTLSTRFFGAGTADSASCEGPETACPTIA